MDPQLFSNAVSAIAHGMVMLFGVAVAVVAMLVIVLAGLGLPWLAGHLDARTAVEAGVVLPPSWAVHQHTHRPRASKRPGRRLVQPLRSRDRRQASSLHTDCCPGRGRVGGDEEGRRSGRRPVRQVELVHR